MTDSVIQFNYSDGNHLTTLYIRANTHNEDFVPVLEEICTEIDNAERFKGGRLNWGNFCLEIIKRLCEWVDRPDGIKITTETKDKNCNTIYKHVIEPISDKYSDFTIQTSKTLNITSKNPIGGELIFNGTLYDFVIELKSKTEDEE